MVRKITTAAAPHEADVLHGDPEATPWRRALPEWLVTNGLGGYASGTIPGLITRRFHGQLIAALPAPHGRTMMLNHLSDLVRLQSGAVHQLSVQPRPDEARLLPSASQLLDFTVAHGLPVWRYACGTAVIEKQVFLPYGQNTVHVTYQLLEGDGPVLIELEPWINFRPHEGRLDTPLAGPYSLKAVDDRYEVAIESDLPPLRMQLLECDGSFTIEGKRIQNVRYRLESARGYEATGDLYSPGFLVRRSIAGGA
ncbi:MAG: glycogen debranching enzyme N-terminal domain-containing protein [Planctomycetota bacterium]